MRHLTHLALLCLTGSVTAHATPMWPDRTQAQLLALAPGEHAVITGFPIGEGRTATASLERIQIYDDSARIIAVTAQGETELPRSELRFFLGYATDTGARIGLSLDPRNGETHATVRGAQGDFRVDGRRLAAGVALESKPLRQQADDGTALDFSCDEDKVDQTALAAALRQIRPSSVTNLEPSAVTLSGPLRKVVVAFDTDGELLNAPVFGGNTTAATNFIAQLVVEMNVMYERDLNLRLLQGTTYLNTNAATDPYVVTDTPAFLNNINEFGNYWFANHARVFRHFAMLLSGKSSSPNSRTMPASEHSSVMAKAV